MNDNTASATGFVKGKKCPPEEVQPICEGLSNAINDRRSDSLTPSIEKGPHTVGSGEVVGKDEGINVALSRISALSKGSAKRDRYIEPLTFDEMKKPIDMCGKEYTFPKAGRSSLGTHAEARIISQAAKDGTLSGGTMFLNVHWHNTTGNSKAPCELCHDLICTTMKNCGTQIYMCDKNNDAVDMEDYCDDSTGTKKGASRSKLEDKLNINMVKKAAAKTKRVARTR